MQENMSLKDMHKKINDIKETYLLLPPEKENVTFLSSLGKTYDENLISNYIAFFLDANKHSFAEQLLQNLVSNYESSDLTINFEGFRITREYPCKDGSRIDILIQTLNTIIAIENKIHSTEGWQQTKRYETQLTEEFPKHTILFIYLGKKTETLSSKKFKPILYLEFIKLFTKIEVGKIDSLQIQYMLNDFINHIEEYIMNVNFSPKSKLYLKNITMIEDLKKNFEKDSEKVFEAFENASKDFFKNYQANDWIFDFKSMRPKQTITKRDWSQNEVSVSFEIVNSKVGILEMNALQIKIIITGKNRYKLWDFILESDQSLEQEFSHNNNNIVYGYEKKGFSKYLIGKGKSKNLYDVEDHEIFTSTIQEAYKEYVGKHFPIIEEAFRKINR